MRWGMRWLRRRRAARGFGTNIASVGGLIFWAALFTGGLGIIQIVRYHAILTTAAQTALVSESQNGCWTAATTQAVASTMQGAGLNPGTVSVPVATTTTTAYGGAVAVSLKTDVTVNMVGLTFQVPLTVGATSTSFYVPASVGEVNPNCVTTVGAP